MYHMLPSSANSSCIHICWEQLAAEHIFREKEGPGVLENEFNVSFSVHRCHGNSPGFGLQLVTICNTKNTR